MCFRIEWSGNLKPAIREKFGISEIFESETAELRGALQNQTDPAHISGVVQRARIELIPDGVEEPNEIKAEQLMKREKQRHVTVDSPFLLVIHREGQAIMMGCVRSVNSPDVDGRVENMGHVRYIISIGVMVERNYNVLCR